MLRVRATKPGFYCAVGWRQGDEFTLTAREHFDESWMERVSEPDAEQPTPAPSVLDGQGWHRSQLGLTRRVCEPVDPAGDPPVLVEFDPFE
jgi:hypothetical protein